MTGAGGIGLESGQLSLVATQDCHNGVHTIHDEEAQRAGLIALGMTFLGVAVISIRLPVTPTAAFVFGALLCLAQLSTWLKRRIDVNPLTRACLELWRQVMSLSLGLRVSILVVLVTTSVVLWLAASPSFVLGELIINVLLSAEMMLFVGPKPTVPARNIPSALPSAPVHPAP